MKTCVAVLPLIAGIGFTGLVPTDVEAPSEAGPMGVWRYTAEVPSLEIEVEGTLHITHVFWDDESGRAAGFVGRWDVPEFHDGEFSHLYCPVRDGFRLRVDWIDREATSMQVIRFGPDGTATCGSFKHRGSDLQVDEGSCALTRIE